MAYLLALPSDWALASQRCQPFHMAGLVLPEAYLQNLFFQITPFAHIAKSAAYFEDLMSDIFANYLSRLKKSWRWLGSSNIAETKISKAHTLQSEPAGPGYPLAFIYHTSTIQLKFCLILTTTKLRNTIPT